MTHHKEHEAEERRRESEERRDDRPEAEASGAGESTHGWPETADSPHEGEEGQRESA
jgi:hypothetical protein